MRPVWRGPTPPSRWAWARGLAGISAAKALSLAWAPLIPVNHLDAHLASAHLGDEPVVFPCLVPVSGGHTMLARMDGPTALSVPGRT